MNKKGVKTRVLGEDKGYKVVQESTSGKEGKVSSSRIYIYKGKKRAQEKSYPNLESALAYLKS